MSNLQDYRKRYYQNYKQRYKQVNIRLTLTEFNQINQLARLNGMSMPKQLKILAHAGYTSQKVLSPDLQKRLDRFSIQVKSIANDLNHMASKYLFMEDNSLDVRDVLSNTFEKLEGIERMMTQFFSHYDH